MAKIQKWGNSLAIRIPKQHVDNLKFKIGSNVQIISSEKNLTITLVEDELDKLDELLNKITTENMHEEYFIQESAVGNEVW